MSHKVLIACDTVQWVFRCPQVWSRLEKTDDQDVRYCSQFQKTVHRAHDYDQLAALARQRLCVAWREPGASSAELLGAPGLAPEVIVRDAILAGS